MTNNQLRVIHKLRAILHSKEFDRQIEAAVMQNEWFTRETVREAVAAICDEMLDTCKVEEWLSRYGIEQPDPPQRIGIVMAGNIPLVGFFDLFCVLIIGHRAVVKPSSKDSVLINYIAEQLGDIEIVNSITIVDKLIATGGNEAAAYYAKEFAGIPSIIRSERHSVAVISGRETESQLQLLLSDMFRYWGLGCRNVNQLYLPADYDPERLPCFTTDFRPFADNYRHQKALLTMLGQSFTDKGGYLLVPQTEQNSSPPPIAVVYYTISNKILELGDVIQCVVADAQFEHPRRVDFGNSQKPRLSDYADAKDVIEFLIKS